MKCPHCVTGIHENFSAIDITNDTLGSWRVLHQICPECKKVIIYLQSGKYISSGIGVSFVPHRSFLVCPKHSSRQPCPPEVPKKFAEDYKEACLVLSDSPKASAALSRRCLQDILREVAKVKPSNLADEIEEIIRRGNLPSNISEALDAVRNIGNFAAHPIKSNSSGEIIEVEPGEAEWNLDVLEALFDFYFVQPELLRKKKEALNQKLKDAGKQPIK
jgi:hypothetical protein